ncbi:von Willebrand factor type A domain-containing protein [Mycena polygramma]|nr:von Willebrand factor type A domain-containing protein [Mycena polygramma]
MSGARLEAAKAALVVMLRSLPAKDTLFQIASFGDGCTKLWDDGSRSYHQETLETATKHIDGMKANYGGTEIRSALQRCFETRKTDRPTSLFVLTDGEAWDLDGVFAEAKEAVERAPTEAPVRVFVLGIGNSASTAMCQGIARVGNGTCMMVGDQESFTGKIARMLKAARAPPIHNISVDWGVPMAEVTTVNEAHDVGSDGDDSFVMISNDEETRNGKGKEKEKPLLNIFDESVDPIQVDNEPAPPPPEVVLSPPPQVQQSPFKIRTLSPGNRLNIYAILQGKTVPKTVILKGLTGDGAEILLPIPVMLSNLPNAPESPPVVHALAARTIIQDLEDGQHAIAIDDPDLLARTVKASIIRLGTEFSIASRETSFVAVDDSSIASSRVRHPDIIHMPNIVTVRRSARGGRGAARVGGGKAARKQLAPSAARTAATPAKKSRSRGRALTQSPHSSKRRHIVPVDDSSDGHAEEFEETAAPTTGARALENLARFQSFDGCFSLAVLSVIQLVVDAAQARAAFSDGISDDIFATILAMTFMRNKLGPQVDEAAWEAMYDKARAFVEATIQISVEEVEAQVVTMLA